MNAININHAKIVVTPLDRSPKENEATTAESTNSSVKRPAAIVLLSQEGLAMQGAMPNKTVIAVAEKSDAEYQAMSYEQLIEERDGTLIQSGNLSFRFVNETGKASEYAAIRLADQMRLNSDTAITVRKHLNEFKNLAANEISNLNVNDFDVGYKDGKPAIISSVLSEEMINKLESLLNRNHKSANTLKDSILVFNDAGLTLINMRIADEKSKFEGANNIYRHRDFPLTMKEFTDAISYSQVGYSEGGTTYNKYSEIIGSTTYGNVYIKTSS